MVYKSVLATCIMISALLAGGTAHAQQSGGVYRWIDKDGQVHFTKSLPPEYADLPYQRINDAGIVVETSAGSLSNKELEKEAAAEKLALEEQKERQRREQENRALLVKFPTMEALEESLTYNLERVSNDIAIAQTMYDTHVQSLAAEVRKAADMQRAGDTVPTVQRRKVAKLQSEIVTHQKRMDALEVSLETVKSDFEKDRDRYLGINAKP